MGAHVVDDAEQHAREKRPGDAAEPADDGDDQRERRQVEARGDGQRGAHRPRDRDQPRQTAAQREDDGAHERGADPDQPRAGLVLDHRADAAPEGREAEEQEQRGSDGERDHRCPDRPARHRDADDRDRVSEDADEQRARGVAPDEHAPDDERRPERQQETQEDPLLAVLAVDRSQQREVEQDGDADRRQHANDGRNEL